MSEWRECKLGEVCDLLDCLHRTPEYSDVGYPMVRVTDVNNAILNTEKCLRVDEETYTSFCKGYYPKNGDIVFTRVGSYGLSAIVKKSEKFCIGQNTSLIISKRINPDFAYYYLLTVEARQQIEGLVGGSTQPTISMENIRKIVFPFPPLPEQRAIASVLSSLDDKIDLLHRQNKTLEAMAETLFRQWFVEEADEGWEEGKIEDYCIHYKEGVKPQDFPNRLFTHFSIPSFDNGMNPVTEAGSEIHSNKYIVPPNCVLFSKLNPHKDKRLWLMITDLPENSICSTEFQVVLPKNKDLLYFIYSWFSLSQNYKEITSGVGGTSGSHQRIDPADIFSFPCPRISDSVIKDFNKRIESFFLQMQKNRVQILTLEKLRDTLLPKLMSGEVRVEV